MTDERRIIDEGEVVAAERLARNRITIGWVFTAAYAAQQVGNLVRMLRDSGIDGWMLGTAIALDLAALLVIVAPVPRRFLNPVQKLLEDDQTLVNRASALKWGYVTTIAAALAIMAVQLGRPVPALPALHMVVSLGLTCALLRFTLLEWRSNRG